MFRSIFAASVIAATVFGASGALAQERAYEERAVSTRNVDFDNPAQVSALYGRLQAAARSVCDSDVDNGPLTAEADKACEAASVHDAIAQVNRPQLTQLAYGAGGGRGHQMAVRERRDDDSRDAR